MERHRLVAQRVEAHRGKVVRGCNLQAVHAVVLQLARRLAEHVHGDEREREGTERGEHLVSSNGVRAHLIDHHGHEVGIRIRKQGNIGKRGDDKPCEQAEMRARDQPEVMERATSGRRHCRGGHDR